MSGIRHAISNYRQIACLLNSLFRVISKKTTKLCITGSLWEEFPRGRRFPWKETNNAKSVSMSWRHHQKLFTSSPLSEITWASTVAATEMDSRNSGWFHESVISIHVYCDQLKHISVSYVGTNCWKYRPYNPMMWGNMLPMTLRRLMHILQSVAIKNANENITSIGGVIKLRVLMGNT